MENLVVNNTPIRTSKNFLINNYKLEDVELPINLKAFENFEYRADKTQIEKLEDDFEFTYGNGEKILNHLNNSCNSGICLNVDEEDTIKVVYKFDDDNLNLVNKLEINAKADCKIIVEYKSETSKKCFHNGGIKVNSFEGAKVKIVVVNLLNESSMNFEAFENSFEDGADVEYTIIDIGSKVSISNYYSDIRGEGARNDLKTIYLGTKAQVKDINYIAELRGEKSFIDIDVQGALDKGSKKNFKGTIDFKRGCKKAYGNENEYAMLLDSDSRSIALPMLLCTEADVEGNHSTASGKVEGDEVFYIMTRGIEYKEAIRLIVKARFNSILDRIFAQDLKEEIIREIDSRLD